jgi:hypothetical protein
MWIQIGVFHNVDNIVYHIYKIVRSYPKRIVMLGSHYPATKTQKKLIYNYYATILWVLPLLCNYPLRNIMYY